MRDVAQSVGITERSVQRILTQLEEAGYISRVQKGRRNYYEVHPDLPLRHPAEKHQHVSALLELVPGANNLDTHEKT
jgi:predicted transcriptional regulator of viral defense system